MLRYDNRPIHQLRFSESGLEISVNRSAMPLFHVLPRTVRVSAVKAHGHVAGNLSIPHGKQGEKGFDDYALRVGLVEPGATMLSAWDRRMAARWVKNLFALAPSGQGINKVHFLNVGIDRASIGKSRTHPMSKLLEERVVAATLADGRFGFTNAFSPPLEVCAIWISADGDDTESSYRTIIDQLVLETIPAK